MADGNMEKRAVFCSGRFYFDCRDEDYADAASRDYRAVLLGNVDKLLYPQESYAVNGHTDYIGPFYFECDGMNADDIVATERGMLERCTDAFFILEKADCPGTVAELIYASSIGKCIHIFYVRLTDDEETESSLHTPAWYPVIMSQQLSPDVTIRACENRIQAEQLALEAIRLL